MPPLLRGRRWVLSLLLKEALDNVLLLEADVRLLIAVLLPTPLVLRLLVLRLLALSRLRPERPVSWQLRLGWLLALGCWLMLQLLRLGLGLGSWLGLLGLLSLGLKLQRRQRLLLRQAEDDGDEQHSGREGAWDPAE